MSINLSTVFDEEEIRDTNDHTSLKVFNGEAIIKSLVIENQHNQIATFQCMGSVHADYANPFLIGDEFELPATTNMLAKCDSYIPYWWIVVSYATAPTTGKLSVHIMGVS